MIQEQKDNDNDSNDEDESQSSNVVDEENNNNQDKSSHENQYEEADTIDSNASLKRVQSDTSLYGDEEHHFNDNAKNNNNENKNEKDETQLQREQSDVSLYGDEERHFNDNANNNNENTNEKDGTQLQREQSDVSLNGTFNVEQVSHQLQDHEINNAPSCNDDIKNDDSQFDYENLLQYEHIEEVNFDFNDRTNVMCQIGDWKKLLTKSKQPYLSGVLTSLKGSTTHVIHWNYILQNAFNVNNKCCILNNVKPATYEASQHFIMDNRSFIICNFDKHLDASILHQCEKFLSTNNSEKKNCMLIFTLYLVIICYIVFFVYQFHRFICTATNCDSSIIIN